MKVLMLGDSITALTPTNLINAEVDNKSLFGATIKYVAKLLDDIDLKSYDKIILLAGINDFVLPTVYTELPSKTDEEIVNELFALVQVLKENSPAEIIVQSLYPIKTNHFDHNYSSSHINNINSLIKKECKKQDAKYFDIHSTLADENDNIKTKYFMDDGLHPNQLGYQVICEKINNEIINQKTKQ